MNLRGGGGLEHLNSTALQFGRFGFKDRVIRVFWAWSRTNFFTPGM